MASLWFGAGNNRNPLLWRRQVLYKIPNQRQPSSHGSSQQRVADVWPGIYAHYLIQNVANWKKANYFKASARAAHFFFHLSNSRTLSVSSCQTDEVIPVRFDEEFLVWVSAEQPLKDTSFLSNKILGLCEELPIYWLQPVNPRGSYLLSIY